MDAHAELVERCARARLNKVGPLSHDAFAELEDAVEHDLDSFVDDASTQAFRLVADALPKAQPSRDDDLLDDDAYIQSRDRRHARLVKACDEALELDGGCTDALLLKDLLASDDPEQTFERLVVLDQSLSERGDDVVGDEDAWSDVFARPRLRVSAALSRMALETARYRIAAQTAEKVSRLAPNDQLGCRHTRARLCASRGRGRVRRPRRRE